VWWFIGVHVGVEKEQLVIVMAYLAVIDDGDTNRLRPVE
jgi:hypothetical protein